MSDTQALQQTVRFAQIAESLGYYRFWVSEHHHSDELAGSSPETLISWLLAHTSRLRVGSGGVMLQHYSPYKVAENFNVLSALSGGRVDLGVGKAPGGLPLATQALQQEVADAQRIGFSTKLSQLDHYLIRDKTFADNLYATPTPEFPPQRFLLGASKESALLAAELGWNFVFAGFINANSDTLIEAVRTYQRLRPHEGKILLALSTIAAETNEAASKLAYAKQNYKVYIDQDPPRTVGSLEQAQRFVKEANTESFRIEEQPMNILHGTSQQIHHQLAAYHQNLGVDEFIIHTPVNDPLARETSIRLLARDFGNSAKIAPQAYVLAR